MHITYKLGSLPTQVGYLNKLMVLNINSNRHSGEIYVPTNCLKFIYLDHYNNYHIL